MRGELIVKDVSVVLTVSYGYSRIQYLYVYVSISVCVCVSVWECVYVGHMCWGLAAVTVTFKQFAVRVCV